LSTRGYITLIDKQKRIISAAYLSSDAYPSYYGVQILDALQESTLSAFIDHLLSEYPGDRDMVDGIKREWYIKSKATEKDYFVDYAYEYETSLKKLNIYYFGQKALTIPHDKIPFYRQLFEIDDSLVVPLRFDPSSCMLKRDFYTELRHQIRNGATLEDLQKLGQEPMLYMDPYRLKGYGWQEDDFAKYIRDSGSNLSLRIHASRFCGSRRYSLYVQTPFYRAPLSTRPLYSPGAAEKELARLIQDRPADIRSTMILFRQIEEYKQAVSQAFADDTVPYSDRKTAAEKLLANILDSLKCAHRQGHPLGCPEDSFTRQLREVYFREAANALQAAEPEHLPLEETILSAENQPSPNEKPASGAVRQDPAHAR